MKIAVKSIIALALSILIFEAQVWAEEPAYPVKVSENGRYFVDQRGTPIFWMGTTQWQIFREYTLEEARLTIERVKANGFVFIQAMLMGVGAGRSRMCAVQYPGSTMTLLHRTRPTSEMWIRW